jgi:peptidoglycan hydrolase-like protein with peptidoglycan-binding domain
MIRAQLALRDYGFYTGPVDGNPGPKTKAAIKAFQERNLLPATGLLNNTTLAMLGIIL